MLRPVPPPTSAQPRVSEVDPARPAGDQSHEDVMGLITDFVADRLAPEERARVRDHLKSCAVCRETNPVRDEDLVRRAIHMAFPQPTERERRELARRVSSLTGIAVGTP